MIYLLNINACVHHLNGRAPRLRNRLRSIRPNDVALCSVVKGELFAGAGRSVDPTRTLARLNTFMAPFVSLPFDDAAAEIYGRIRAQLEAAGTPIGPYDLQIAAIALVHELTLVTHNTREFSRVVGLRIEDWQS